MSGVTWKASSTRPRARWRETMPLLPVRTFLMTARERESSCRLSSEAEKTSQHSFCVKRCWGAAVPRPVMNIGQDNARRQKGKIGKMAYGRLNRLNELDK